MTAITMSALPHLLFSQEEGSLPSGHFLNPMQYPWSPSLDSQRPPLLSDKCWTELKEEWFNHNISSYTIGVALAVSTLALGYFFGPLAFVGGALISSPIIYIATHIPLDPSDRFKEIFKREVVNTVREYLKQNQSEGNLAPTPERIEQFALFYKIQGKNLDLIFREAMKEVGFSS